jgi:hypothetical protein
MKYVLLLVLVALGSQAADLQAFIHTPGNTADGPALGSTYSFPDTPFGASSTIHVRLRNTSTTQSYLVRTVWSSDSSFVVDGVILNNCLGPNGFEDMSLTFAPTALGAMSTPIQIASLAYPASAGCPATPPQNVLVNTLATVSGNGTSPTYNVSLTLNGNSNPLISGNTIAFGNIPLGTTQAATVIVQNATASTLAIPAPAVVAAVFSQSPYSLGPLATWPSSLAPGASASFTLNFAPTQQALVTATLTLGSRSYPLTGTGIPGPGLESLLVSYTLPTGVHYNITTATPVDFGSMPFGSSANFIFTVSNPATNFAAETIPTISISGQGFTLGSLATLPVVLKPGDSTAFTITLSPSQSGTQNATLAIGTLQFSLTGKAVAPTLNPSFQITPQPLASSEQAQLSIQLASAAQDKTIGTLTVSFTSAVNGVSGDPAILFVSSGTRTTNVTFAAGATSGTFANGQNSLTFQTGTTAGSIKFTLSFADGQSFTKSMDITPGPIQISSASGARQSPYLVIDLTAFDNTYSAGKLLFNFYDTKGALLTPGGMGIDETQDFHNYFFLNNQAGGAFSLQAKFPVTGDITAIGAADVTIQNASGQSQTQHVTF